MKLINFILFLISFIGYAQKNDINVDYKFNLKNHLFFDFEYNSTLIMNDSICFFDWGDRNFPSQEKFDKEGFPISISKVDSIGSFNLRMNDTIYSRFFGVNKHLICEENLPSFDWIEFDTTKTILNHKCYKIKTNFRGRTYTAWYTKEIKNNGGPWKFFYSKGLILEVYDDTNKINIIAQKISFNWTMQISSYVDLIKNQVVKNLEQYIKNKRKVLAELEVADFDDNIELKYEWDE